MHIAFFLIPKKDLIYLKYNATMRQALELMEYNRHTAIPLIDDEGKYRGTLTEGDLLWKLKNTPGLTFHNADKVKLTKVRQRVKNQPVSIDARMEDLLSRAIEQNFIPVVDDDQTFIGIVRRRDILDYFYNRLDTSRLNKIPAINHNSLTSYEACLVD